MNTIITYILQQFGDALGFLEQLFSVIGAWLGGFIINFCVGRCIDFVGFMMDAIMKSVFEANDLGSPPTLGQYLQEPWANAAFAVLRIFNLFAPVDLAIKLGVILATLKVSAITFRFLMRIWAVIPKPKIAGTGVDGGGG